MGKDKDLATPDTYVKSEALRLPTPEPAKLPDPAELKARAFMEAASSMLRSTATYARELFRGRVDAEIVDQVKKVAIAVGGQEWAQAQVDLAESCLPIMRDLRNKGVEFERRSECLRSIVEAYHAARTEPKAPLRHDKFEAMTGPPVAVAIDPALFGLDEVSFRALMERTAAAESTEAPAAEIEPGSMGVRKRARVDGAQEANGKSRVDPNGVDHDEVRLRFGRAARAGVPVEAMQPAFDTYREAIGATEVAPEGGWSGKEKAEIVKHLNALAGAIGAYFRSGDFSGRLAATGPGKKVFQLRTQTDGEERKYGLGRHLGELCLTQAPPPRRNRGRPRSGQT